MEKTKISRRGQIIRTVLVYVLFFLAFLCFFATLCYHNIYGDTGFDSVLYTLFGGLDGMQSGLLMKFFINAIIPSLLCAAILLLLTFPSQKMKWAPHKKLMRVISVCLCICVLVYSAFSIGLVRYIQHRIQLTDLYESEYADPNEVTITFPEEKRNLIYIYLESMETSFLSTEQGGAMDTCLIPELYDLAQTYTNFSHNEDVGGLIETPGATWTVGAMVAQTSGVPLIAPSNLSDLYNGYGKDGVFLPGLTTLMDVLHENGYYQALMVGSDANFGGRKTYYSTHGVDTIYDIYTARADGIVPENYYVWWGMEDMYLYEYAKQELVEMAEMDQPFAFSMLTVDTHHVGGYTCSLCESEYEESYDNVYECASRQLAAFVSWIMEQDFYENTTIIITGDHFSMDSGYFNRVTDEDYIRHGYNCFINAPVEAVNTKNRSFCGLDMFPTTLAAMGCTIDGDRLGFGVNLFSDQNTLIEEFGYSAFAAELSKRTTYYAENFY